MSTPDPVAKTPDAPRDLAHDLRGPSAKLRLYARALADALPPLLAGRTDITGTLPLGGVLADIPARIERLAAEIDAVAARVHALAEPPPAGAGDAALAKAAERSVAGRPAGRPRVLLVEDDADSRDLSAMMLDWNGWDVTTAGDGGPALSLLERERFDMVLMDCRLPELDGWTATQHVRAGGPNQHTPVIGLTASPDGADAERGLAVGMDDWIVKPLTAAHLADLRQRLDH
jgi:CheY-like chemotaxis protein